MQAGEETYTLETLHFLHVLSVIVWFGGVLALNVLAVRVGSGPDRASQATLLRLSDFYGRAVIAPARRWPHRVQLRKPSDGCPRRSAPGTRLGVSSRASAKVSSAFLIGALGSVRDAVEGGDRHRLIVLARERKSAGWIFSADGCARPSKLRVAQIVGFAVHRWLAVHPRFTSAPMLRPATAPNEFPRRQNLTPTSDARRSISQGPHSLSDQT